MNGVIRLYTDVAMSTIIRKSLIAVLLPAAVAVALLYRLLDESPPGQDGTTPLLALAPDPSPSDAAYRFAVIGDYGDNSDAEARVAALVAGWEPDFVVTTGDNNYPDGGATTIDRNIGQYYSAFIGNYSGDYGPGSPDNRFWPSPGNHDWHSIGCSATGCDGPYMQYFTLPGNERYYTADYGLVRLYALDSHDQEPDGTTADSAQAAWLRDALAGSEACFDVVYFHHPPYSSGKHGSREGMRWPFGEWGADVVLSGHEHSYERLDVGGMPYFVNGIGGKSLYPFTHVGELPAGVTSLVRYNANYGAMLITAAASGLTAQLFDADGVLIDQYTLDKSCAASPTPTATPEAATNTPAATSTPSDTPSPTPTMDRSFYLPIVTGGTGLPRAAHLLQCS